MKQSVRLLFILALFHSSLTRSKHGNKESNFVVQGFPSSNSYVKVSVIGRPAVYNVLDDCRFDSSLRLERNRNYLFGERRRRTVFFSRSETDIITSGTKDSSKSNDNVFTFLSRLAEISSTVIDAATPLILSAIQVSMRDTDTADAIDSSNGTTSITNDNDVLKETTDIWDTFWSSPSGPENITSMTTTNAQRVVSALEKLGPTYVKFGQALASRPDIIPPSLALSLSSLQDNMLSFDTLTAKSIIEEELSSQCRISRQNISSLVESLSDEPVAAASVGQVYKGYIEGVGPVAVKVQRPGIRDLVARDAVLLRNIALFLESIPSPSALLQNDDDENGRLISTELVAAVDEFMSRIVEELDYSNEAKNAETFARLYSNQGGSARKALPNREGVIVPEIYFEFCTKNVIVMEWIEGTKLTVIGKGTDFSGNTLGEMAAKDEVEENLALVEKALHVTLSQLLDTGVMHADPHGGNLLKVKMGNGKNSLAYLDFGLLATIPSSVRDALVCAVAQLIFEKDVEAVASLFGELDLLPAEVMENPSERKALTVALTKTMREILQYPPGMSLYSPPTLSTSNTGASTRVEPEKTSIPMLRFDKLLDGLVRLVPRFKFQLPPYFINNARALGTLEGLARSLDPEFNCLQIMYPYALYRLMRNPTESPVVTSTLQSLIRSKDTGRINRQKVLKLLRDTSLLTGFGRRKVLWDILKTKGGRKLALQSLLEELKSFLLLRGLRRKIQGAFSY